MRKLGPVCKYLERLGLTWKASYLRVPSTENVGDTHVDWLTALLSTPIDIDTWMPCEAWEYLRWVPPERNESLLVEVWGDNLGRLTGL